MPNLCFVTCVWRRPKLAEAMIRHTLRVMGPDDRMVVVASPEDPEQIELPEDPRLALEMAPNRPISEKWETALRWADWHGTECDAFVILGSDDFISEVGIELIREAVETQDCGGFRSCFVWRPADDKWGLFPGYGPESPRHGETIGSGRFYRRDLLDKIGWDLWPMPADKGLDAMSNRVLAEAGARPYCISVPCIVDVKSDPDVDIGTWESMGAVGTLANLSDVLPEETLSAIARATRQGFMEPIFAPTNSPTLSAALIVKNESWSLARCLRSLRGIVDEVTVILDSHSTDDTERIATEAGCRIFRRQWTGFGEQRTASLQKSRGPWVLVIDADEVLSDAEGLREWCLAQPDEVDGGMIDMKIGAMSGQTTNSGQIRVMRRERASYKYRRHNRLVGISNVRRAPGAIRTSYQGRTPESLEAAVCDLVEEFSENPTDATLAYHLGHTFLGLGKWDAAKQWSNRAIQLGLSHTPEDGGGANVVAAAMMDAIQARGVADGLEAVEEATRLAIGAGFGDLADVWRHRIGYCLVKWLECVTSPVNPYPSVPQVSCPEMAVVAPQIVQLLKLPIRLELVRHEPTEAAD